MKILALLITAMMLFSVCEATTYYVSKAGNNNDGLSWASAFIHPDSVNAHMVGGDTAYFRPNDTFWNVYMSPPGGTDLDRTAYLCSANVFDGSAGRPVLWAAEEVTGWVMHDANGGDSIYRSTFIASKPFAVNTPYPDSNVNLCVVNDVIMAFRHLVWDSSCGGSPYNRIVANDDTSFMHWYDSASGAIYINPPDLDFLSSGQKVYVSTHPVFEIETGDSCVDIRGLTMGMAKHACIYWNGAYNGNCAVTQCVLMYVNGEIGENHSFFQSNAADGIIRHNVTIAWDTAMYTRGGTGWGSGISGYKSYQAGCAMNDNDGEHTGSFAVLYSFDDVLFEYNYISNIQGTGFYLKGDPDSAVRMTVRFNELWHTGKWDGPNDREGNGYGVCIGYMNHACSIYGNYFGEMGEAVMAFSHQGSEVPTRYEYGRHWFCFNTIIRNHSGIQCEGSYSRDWDSLNYAKYNIFYDHRNSAPNANYCNTHWGWKQGTVVCTSDVVDSNIWWDGGSDNLWGSCGGDACTESFATWQAAGADENGWEADPNFTDTTVDYSRTAYDTLFTNGITLDVGDSNVTFWTQGAWQPSISAAETPITTTINGIFKGMTIQ